MKYDAFEYFEPKFICERDEPVRNRIFFVIIRVSSAIGTVYSLDQSTESKFDFNSRNSWHGSNLMHFITKFN